MIPALETKTSRRRFLQISASGVIAGALFPQTLQAAPSLQKWRGQALGAAAEINLVHQDVAEARTVFQSVEAEIIRLEGLFSLYRPASEISRLNKNGILENPSLELIELLSLAGQLHDVTQGAFDPSVQPLWAYYAARREDSRLHAEALKRTGFKMVRVDSNQVRLERGGMALTLNGIAQGFITDRISDLLKSKGFTNVAVNIGELRLNGNGPFGSGANGDTWPVTLRPDPDRKDLTKKTYLSDMAVASSAQTGTTFDTEKVHSHILDPRTGLPVRTDLKGVSVVARSAALADGLSTAALVLGERGLREVMNAYPDTAAYAVRSNGDTAWIGT